MQERRRRRVRRWVWHEGRGGGLAALKLLASNNFCLQLYFWIAFEKETNLQSAGTMSPAAMKIMSPMTRSSAGTSSSTHSRSTRLKSKVG